MSTIANPVPLTTAAVIARIESSNNAKATRFERRIFNKVTNEPSHTLPAIVRLNKCSQDTARVIYSTSYGLFQIMGFNLYSPICNINMPIWQYLNDDLEQAMAFQAFIVAKGINFTFNELRDDDNKRLQFAVKYNGSSDYAALIAKTIRSMSA